MGNDAVNQPNLFINPNQFNYPAAKTKPDGQTRPDGIKTADSKVSCIFVIMGGTGDLTKRKLIPALYKLFAEEKVSPDFAVVAVGRKQLSHEEYRLQMEQSTIQYGEVTVKKAQWDQFAQSMYYQSLDMVDDPTGYQEFDRFLRSLDGSDPTKGNRMYYLAVGPNLFLPILKNLKENGMLENQTAWQRIMIEKPFGSNLESARTLQSSLMELLPEDKIFRIDHYLGKEMLQNIVAIRFSNSIFESLWNQKYIENIQINSAETIGVDSRGGYYEKSGILRDMVQSHILQMLALICMEPPINLEADSIRDEKVKVLKSLQLFDVQSATENIVVGQYDVTGKEDGIVKYRQEKNVDANSMVPTYIAIKTGIRNFRWGGVPIYIQAGKRLDRKNSEIIIQFKKLPGINIYNEYKQTGPDYLIVQIQPEEGIKFQINIKTPGDGNSIEKVEMNYCQTCRYDISSPLAYERLILEALNDAHALFTRWDEVEAAWEYVDSIEASLPKEPGDFPNYKAGSAGPKEAGRLLKDTKLNKEASDEITVIPGEGI